MLERPTSNIQRPTLNVQGSGSIHPALSLEYGGEERARHTAGAAATSGRSAATALAPRGRPIVRAVILSCNRMIPSISASGRGGHPGTYTSTGTTRSTPLTTLYPYLKYGPPPTVQAPMAMTYFGSGIWWYSRLT